MATVFKVFQRNLDQALMFQQFIIAKIIPKSVNKYVFYYVCASYCFCLLKGTLFKIGNRKLSSAYSETLKSTLYILLSGAAPR